MRLSPLALLTLAVVSQHELSQVATAQTAPQTPRPSAPNVVVPVVSAQGNPGTNIAPPESIPPGELAVTALEVQITGATPELEQLIRQTIRTRPGGQTSSTQQDRDVAAILKTGFFTDAQVTVYNQTNGVRVVYQVQPIMVRGVQLSNAQALTPAVVNPIFQPLLNAPISPSGLRKSIQQVNEWYQQNGYALAQVVNVVPNEQGILTVDVAEGVVGKVNIRFVDQEGKEKPGRTKEDFLRRELKLAPGQVFRVDVARQDLQQLYQLGLFENANVSLNGDSRQVDVTYELVEAPARAVNVGGGYSDDTGIFGTITYNDRNLGGTNQQLGVNVQVSRRDLQFNTRYSNPYRASDPDRLGYSVEAFRRRELSQTFNDPVKLPNGDQPRETRLGGGVAVNRPIGDGWQGSLGLNYTRTSIRDRDGKVSPVDALGNQLSASGTGIDDKVSVVAGVRRDLRNNPINPTSGSVLNLSTEQTIPIGSGNILMNRVQANYSQFVPVNLMGRSQPEVLAFNVQGGTTIGDLPPYEAFNIGGINSVRGYETGQVGSGRSYVLATAEYRFPIFNPVGGVLFADFGTDLGSGDTVPGQPAVVRNKPGSGFGYGAGVRVNSPLGLIRADFGINDRGESRFQFGLGQRF